LRLAFFARDERKAFNRRSCANKQKGRRVRKAGSDPCTSPAHRNGSSVSQIFDPDKGEAFHIGFACIAVVTLQRISTMEAVMHGSFDGPGENESIYRSWRMAIFALPVLLLTALIALLIAHTDLPNWMSEAVQAEFGNAKTTTKAAPTERAQPARDVGAVKAD
jgi:hypothetical protein